MAAAGFIQKMRWKGDPILLVNPPDDITPLLDFPHSASSQFAPSPFVILFVKTREEVSRHIPALTSLNFDESVLWIAYPKKSSRIPSDLSRDILWNQLRGAGLTGVSLISINDDWSAARYRPEKEVKHSEKASMDLPDDMFSLLQTDADARAFFFGLSATNRKEYIMWIKGAKRAETRTRRLDQLLDRLHAGLKNPSEKLS